MQRDFFLLNQFEIRSFLPLISPSFFCNFCRPMFRTINSIFDLHIYICLSLRSNKYNFQSNFQIKYLHHKSACALRGRNYPKFTIHSKSCGWSKYSCVQSKRTMFFQTMLFQAKPC